MATATQKASLAAAAASREIGDALQNNILLDRWRDTRNDHKAKCLYVAASVLFAIFLAIFFVQTLFLTKDASRNRESFVVFTDGDVDDLLALHMLFRRSDVAVPLIVVAGNGIATPYAAFKNVRNFVTTCAGEGSRVATNTRVVLGASMSARDSAKAFMDSSTTSSSAPSSSSASSPGTYYDDPSLYCTYYRFARSSMAVSVAADSLFGQSEYLAKLAREAAASDANSKKIYASATTLNMFTEFGKVVNGAITTGTKITLLSLAPLTDLSSLLDSLPSSTITSAIKLVIVSGGRFATTPDSGVSDAALFTRDSGSRGSYGSSSELNFFLDPEAANNVLSPMSRYTSSLLPTVVVPLDVAGSNSAYTDFPEQWSKISSAAANAKSKVTSFLARLLRSYSTFEGPTFFPYKGTPKSIAAVSVALDRRVRTQLYAFRQEIGVMTWSTAQTLRLEKVVGRSGSVTAAGGAGVGKPDIIVGFTSAATTSSGSSSTTAVSRAFLDSYLSFVALPWP